MWRCKNRRVDLVLTCVSILLRRCNYMTLCLQSALRAGVCCRDACPGWGGGARLRCNASRESRSAPRKDSGSELCDAALAPASFLGQRRYERPLPFLGARSCARGGGAYFYLIIINVSDRKPPLGSVGGGLLPRRHSLLLHGVPVFV